MVLTMVSFSKIDVLMTGYAKAFREQDTKLQEKEGKSRGENNGLLYVSKAMKPKQPLLQKTQKPAATFRLHLELFAFVVVFLVFS